MLSVPNSTIVHWTLEIEWKDNEPVNYRILGEWSDDLNSMEILTDRFEPAGEVDDAVWEYFEYLEEANEEINLTMMDGWHIDENEILNETVDAIEDWFRSIEYERNCA